MKTNADYALLAKTITELYSLERIPAAVTLLRSIELDAWREARELVEKLPRSHYGEIKSRELIGAIDRHIQQLQLK